jgi:hypothetical protein
MHVLACHRRILIPRVQRDFDDALAQSTMARRLFDVKLPAGADVLDPVREPSAFCVMTTVTAAIFSSPLSAHQCTQCALLAFAGKLRAAGGSDLGL